MPDWALGMWLTSMELNVVVVMVDRLLGWWLRRIDRAEAADLDVSLARGLTDIDPAEVTDLLLGL